MYTSTLGEKMCVQFSVSNPIPSVVPGTTMVAPPFGKLAFSVVNRARLVDSVEVRTSE